MIVASLIAIAAVFFLLFVVTFTAYLGRVNRSKDEAAQTPTVADGFITVETEAWEGMTQRLGEAQRLLGEERAAHKAEMIQVQSKAISDMQEFRASVELEMAQRKRATAQETTARSRVSLVAKISEHFAPLLKGFPYNFKDARHIGELFDFLVFDGLEDGEIRNVVFLEVKTKRSGARVSNPRERMLRDAINAGRVSYEIFVPDVEEAKYDREEGAAKASSRRRTAVDRAQPGGA